MQQSKLSIVVQIKYLCLCTYIVLFYGLICYTLLVFETFVCTLLILLL